MVTQLFSEFGAVYKYSRLTYLLTYLLLVGCREMAYRKLSVSVLMVMRFDWSYIKVKGMTPLRSESPPQKCSGMARVLKGFHSFTCTSTRSSAIGMSHTCLCLPSRSWYSFTDPGGIEG